MMNQELNLNFEKINLSISRSLSLEKHLKMMQVEKDKFKQFTKVSCDIDGFNNHQLKNHFKFELTIGEKFYSGETGVNGNDALWIPFSDSKGLKVISENEKYQSLEKSLETINLISKSNADIFPKIYSFSIEQDKNTKKPYLILIMENLKNTEDKKFDFEEIDFVPAAHHFEVESMLPVSPSVATKVITELERLKLEPEDGWYKNSNFVNNKIIDFHRFKVNSSRYLFPSPSYSRQDIDTVYENMVSRFSIIKDSSGLQKWKGKIYQGFNFQNGATMPGYKSPSKSDLKTPNTFYDSYRKLAFFPINNISGKKVLDIGSNQGFFTFQASLAGAHLATGIEITKPDVEASEDIKRITELENVEFLNCDAVSFIENTEDIYGLVIMNSVLHQIYPNFENSENFMNKISNITETLIFETPLNHKYMYLSPRAVQEKLKSLGFKHVRLVYIYDAYSSGYRANYICHTERYEHPEKFKK